MKRYFFLFALMCKFLLFGGESIDPIIGGESKTVIDKRENYFDTSTAYAITPNVNPITGELVYEECDLVVAGCEPLSLRRYYNHKSSKDPRTGGWRLNPEIFCVANFEYQDQDIFAAVGEDSGGIYPLKIAAKKSQDFIFKKTPGFSHFNIGGQCHPANTKFNYTKADGNQKCYFRWKGEIIDGSGTKKTFCSASHHWLAEDIRPSVYQDSQGQIQPTFIVNTPNCWTPYQLPVYEERRPNGNIICYDYIPWKKEEIGTYGHLLPLLRSITAYNSDKSKVLGYLHFSYTKQGTDVHTVTIKGSDGREVRHQLSKAHPRPLELVETPNKPKVTYSHHRDHSIKAVIYPERRKINTEFDDKGRVAFQATDVELGVRVPIARYEYHSKDTVVLDGENNKTVYTFDKNKQLLCTSKYLDSKLYRAERLTWDSATGNLLMKSIEDSSGKPWQITEYTYDQNHNPIVERVGDGKEWRVITRTFSTDGFNLKLTESDREGKVVCFKYIPNTNLLNAELVYIGDKICKRAFYFYDDCAICTKTIVDDGSSEDPTSFEGVTFRKITEITPKQTLPCFGLPEVVIEKTIDASGNEVMLSKRVYTYTPFGKVAKEEHYGASGEYCYSICNEYDSRERLVAVIDGLGHRTSYGYDANHNLISIQGPKPLQLRQINYDLANRPTRITERQVDGSELVTEKKYDKLGRVIEERDLCKNVTKYEYDGLSRKIKTIYPDGAVERIEYDLLDRPIREINPNREVIEKKYNSFGQVSCIIYPDGSTEEFGYTATGLLAFQKEKNGAITTYEYDVFDHLVKEENSFKTKVYEWTPFCKLSESDELLTTHYSYDFAGRKIAEKKGDRTTFYYYNDLGQLQRTKEGDLCHIEEHDCNGQLIEKREECGGKILTKESYEYDASGNCIKVIGAKGIHQKQYTTDDRLYATMDPLGFVTRHEYIYTGVFTKKTTDPKGIQEIAFHDSRGRESTLFKKNLNDEMIQKCEFLYDLAGNKLTQEHTLFSKSSVIGFITHRWEYGPCGRVERFIESEGRATCYFYDNKGRLSSLEKPNGKTLYYEYDDLGRRIRLYSEDFDYNYKYDAHDQILIVYEALSKTTTKREYDALGNIVVESLANGLTFQNRYDAFGRRVLCLLPDRSEIGYTYEGNSLFKVKRANFTHTYSTRDLDGQVVLERLVVGKEAETQYDSLGRIKSYKTPFIELSYPSGSYDGNGNLVSYEVSDGLGKKSYHFQYDDLDQLISENEHSYECDSLYNRLKKDDYEYQVDNYSQVNHDGVNAYEYDGSGNLISDGKCRFSYDSLDRLIRVESGDHCYEYTYDAFNRRLSKQVNGQRIRFLWDGENEIGSVDEGGVIRELRILGEGLGAEIGAAVFFELGGSVYIPLHDHRGCLVAVVGAKSGKLRESYRYTAFGEELVENRISPWRFSSKRLDPETSLIYFGRRYYHPSLGRFITQDPSGFADGPNLYAYLKNSPLSDFDPYGLWSWRGVGHSLWNIYSSPYISSFNRATGIGEYAFEMLRPCADWWRADFQQEYLCNHAPLQQKAQESRGGFKSFLSALRENPKATLFPATSEFWQDRWNARLQGKAIAELGLLALTALEGGSVVANIGRFSKFEQGISLLNSTRKPINHLSPPILPASIKHYRNGITGRSLPNNLREQFALKEIISDPNKGRSIIKNLNDPRWKGWEKFQHTHTLSNEIEINIHYVGKREKGILIAVDDFKFIDTR